MLPRFLVAFLVAVILFSLTGWGIKRELQHLRNLQQATVQKADIRITIIEGKRREEIGQQLQVAGICSSSDFLAASQGLEGTLFPDTYRFFPSTSASEVIHTLTKDYAQRTASLAPTPDQLNLAAIVEREAKQDSDRAAIAGVYANRLRVGMTLDADPTVQYAKDSLAYSQSLDQQHFQFWKVITQADYRAVQSPYNTYLQTGLPPTPIANPGLPSIIAAQHPTANNYFYFQYKNGQLLLEKTLQEHLNNE